MVDVSHQSPRTGRHDEFLARPRWAASAGHVPSIDGVRAASVLIVLIGHLLLPSALVGVSALGLKTFFFISGFLICRLLLAEQKATGRISLADFYARRVFRLYPVIVVYVIISSAVAMLRDHGVDPLDLASVFFYFVNYRVIHYEHVGGLYTIPVQMLWSLSIEEHFYLVAPLVIFILRGHARKLLLLAGLVCVAALGLRLAYAAAQPAIVDTLELYWRTETRVDSIAFGVILACLAESEGGRRIIDRLTSLRGLIAGAALLLLSYCFRDNYFQNTWRFTIQGLALMPILASVVFGQPAPALNRLLNSSVAVWIGAVSYSLYVWHGSIDFFFGPWAGMVYPPLLPWVHLALAFAMAVPSYYLIERPVVRWRHRRVAARARSSAQLRSV